MQDNYNKNLENKGWAQMSALLDVERPVAIPFWKRAWRKLALGLVLLLAMLTAFVYLYNGDAGSTTQTSTTQTTESIDNQSNIKIASTNTTSIIDVAQPNDAAIENTAQSANIATPNSAQSTSNNNTSRSRNAPVSQSTKAPLQANATPFDTKNKAPQDANLLVEKATQAVETINPLWLLTEHREDSLAALEIAPIQKVEVITKEPIAYLEQLPVADFGVDYLVADIDSKMNMPKAKRIENFILTYDNGYDFGLKNYSSGVFVGLDIPLKNKKWSFRPSLGYNSTRSVILASQNSQPEGAVASNEPIVDPGSEITVYVTDSDDEFRNEDKAASFFTNYRINELHLQLKTAYRLNTKWSVYAGLTPTYLLNNTQGILPTLKGSAQNIEVNFDANQRAVLGVANHFNLNSKIGVDYQVAPKFSVSAAYNHGWIKKARTDLLDTKLKSINLSLNYHF